MIRSPRHCAHNDRRRIIELEKQVDALLVAFARYGRHELSCATRTSTNLAPIEPTEPRCNCGLIAVLETKGLQ